MKSESSLFENYTVEILTLIEHSIKNKLYKDFNAEIMRLLYYICDTF